MDLTEIKDIIPTVNVPEKKECEIVKAEKLVGYYDELFSDLRDSNKEIDEVLKCFTEMVINGGDATTSSKEALVNLLKLKADGIDRKTRVVDLLTKTFMRDPSPKYLSQQNTINIEEGSRKRQLIKGKVDEK